MIYLIGIKDEEPVVVHKMSENLIKDEQWEAIKNNLKKIVKIIEKAKKQ